MRLELRGQISEGESRPLTCCESVGDIKIGEISLFDALEKLFSQDAEDYWNDNAMQSPQYGIKYVILDEPPTNTVSFNDLSTEVIQEMLYASHVNGCYSEYTCGYGGFDYVCVSGGRSIFRELKSSIGKYIHFVI